MDTLIKVLVKENFAPERILPGAPMSRYTTFRVGGRAGGGGEERLDELSVRVELFIGEGGQRGKKQRQKQGKAAFHGHLMPRRES